MRSRHTRAPLDHAARGPGAIGPTYLESSPSAALATWVECYWSIRATATPVRSARVVPDGCCDIIVDLGANVDVFVVGTMREAIVTPFAARIDLFGVRFRPGCALPFLDVSMHEITDRRVALDELWGSVAGVLADTLASVEPADRVACAERVLAERMGVVRREDGLAADAITLLRRARGGMGVRETAASLGIGERRLERAFDRCVGLSPKQLVRVLRFQRAVRRLPTEEGPSWTAIALEAGYADQSHLIREFRALAGVTPVEYAVERRLVGFVQDGGSDRR